jgi:hypothetical protein
LDNPGIEKGRNRRHISAQNLLRDTAAVALIGSRKNPQFVITEKIFVFWYLCAYKRAKI